MNLKTSVETDLQKNKVDTRGRHSIHPQEAPNCPTNWEMVVSDIEQDKYGETKANVSSVKPGITGLWQMSGGHGVSFEECIQNDIDCIQKWKC